MCVEDEAFGFGLGALGWEFLSIPDERDSGCVADSNYKLASGVIAGRGRSDESLLRDELSVGGDGDPGVFAGPDHQGELGGGLLGGSLDDIGRCVAE